MYNVGNAQNLVCCSTENLDNHLCFSVYLRKTTFQIQPHKLKAIRKMMAMRKKKESQKVPTIETYTKEIGTIFRSIPNAEWEKNS